MTALQEIGSAACLSLLGSEHVGRLAYVDGSAPVIRPVNYYLADEHSIIIRTHYGSSFSGLKGAPVSFEIDKVDNAQGSGWSVVVTGTAEPITDIDELVVAADPRYRPWAPGEKGQFLRIRVAQISGRELSA
ncbi:pyridoxamine 5'-phosphate oxidase family protein [Hoyosella sp. YIM 151337]|uniref:pyridoxamine 5'-phosphate oxidase family protein n=1 Tax=Hoyosella sp. YIM 151337 TaxID=2992742 RepID=UPI002235B4DD|nr:pyridoxamine 5'-phosphate oxidase family protein [Hoyosella sp. YIM 151337]MCW4352432.1 pyridoxamine 5'-phosphate oxidase family protein [Hoyosella sp. YIM 151337]